MRQEQAQRPCAGSRLLMVLPTICLLAAALVGVIVGVKSVRPEWQTGLLSMRTLQPLHAFLGVSFVLTGLAAGTIIVLEQQGGRFAGRGLFTGALVLFVVGSAGLIATGHGSGVEYVAWPIGMTVLIGGLFTILSVNVVRHLRTLACVSAEGAWLLGLGLVLVVLGLAERSSEVMAAPGMTRALTIEWHALDTFFAGWNAALYGLGMLAICRPGERGRPLRSRWMFVLAAFCLLSTFGHHHYMSPQPAVLKSIALLASMLAAVSFVRHVWTLIRERGHKPGEGPPEQAFFRAAEVFTLAAIGSGVLLAIPHINIVLHGTLAIVAHSMGSMIGVNVMLILGIFVRYAGRNDPAWSIRLTRRVRWVGVALVLVCVDLLLAGAAEGILRLDLPFQEFDSRVRLWLVPLPAFGLVLAATIGLLCREVWLGLQNIAGDAESVKVLRIIEAKPGASGVEPIQDEMEVGAKLAQARTVGAVSSADVE
ncbi:MAG: hypothetical protein D6695_05225 [Planctomycetota bacterium]|nr:MAG: hypothetical protein D6695_05225 [Planctomycetota bacterium]